MFVILCNVLQAKSCTSFYIVLLNCVLFDFVSLALEWGGGGPFTLQLSFYLGQRNSFVLCMLCVTAVGLPSIWRTPVTSAEEIQLLQSQII